LENKKFSNFQFADANYSGTRSILPIVTTKEIFLAFENSIPNLRGTKREYTDIWVLGINDFNVQSKSDLDNKINDEFYKQIEKYRYDNDLPPYSKNNLGTWS
jgi:hypothetical protein